MCFLGSVVKVAFHNGSGEFTSDTNYVLSCVYLVTNVKNIPGILGASGTSTALSLLDDQVLSPCP